MIRKNKTRGDHPPLRAIYHELYRAWGPQGWWPGRTPFEVIVGAILTQNTAWTNVEQAIRRLRAQRALRPRVLHATPHAMLAEWIRPAGYFNVKARRLHAFTTLLVEQFDGQLKKLFALDDELLRTQLLSVNGIGPETADSIMLYAAGRPRFVVDAYTKRFMVRHGWTTEAADYDALATLFTDTLPVDTTLYNEFHALIVRLGKDHCRPRPRCENCPLRHRLPRDTRDSSRMIRPLEGRAPSRPGSGS